jgi:3alpha(or 20beta)-hydroxysteroid dehydrogenase
VSYRAAVQSWKLAAPMETDDALWQRHIQINQYGCFLGMKAAVPAMERSGGGFIVNYHASRLPE